MNGARRFWNGPGDGEIMRQACCLEISLCRDEDGELSGGFEIKGYFGASEMVDFAGLPPDTDAMDFAKNLMAQFARGKPTGGTMT